MQLELHKLRSPEMPSLGRLRNSHEEGPASWDARPTPVVPIAAVATRRWHLLIMSMETLARVALPAAGEVVIGRLTQARACIDDPRASREHARLRLGDVITVEDLGSASGTRVRGALIGPASRWRFIRARR